MALDSLNDANILCIRFDFGIPLEDIFPPNNIHPRLHNLFYQTTLALKNDNLPLSSILKQVEVSISEAMELKEALINGRLCYRQDIEPSSFFWLIRHFFGLLPLPLLPRFTDSQAYNWEYLATLCRLHNMKPNHQLESEISWWLHKLPKANVMLIYTLINFLRKMCLKPRSQKRLDWNSVTSITTYFSSSLFFRPYRPGFVTKGDSLYYPLLCYLIMNWPRIRIHKNYRSLPQDDKLAAIWEYEEPNSEQIRIYNKFMKNRLVDCACQTSSWLVTATGTNTDNVTEEQETSSKNKENSCVSLSLDEKPKAESESKANAQEDEEKIENSQQSETENEFKTSTPQKEKKCSKQIGLNGECFDDSMSDEPVYEEICDEPFSNMNSNSKTIIYEKNQKSLTPKIFFKQKMLKANKSLVSVISKVNEKIKSKQELLKSKSGTKLESYKYNLLKDTNVAKVQSLHINNCTNESPNIKYKKLMTL